MSPVLSIILVIVGVLIVLAILLKIFAKHPFANYVLLFGLALALLIMGFVCNTKANQKDFNGMLACVEGALLFGYMIFGYADIAFDRNEYLVTTASYDSFNNTINVETRLESSSQFWGCIGTSALVGFGVSFLLHGIAKSGTGSMIMGIIGILCTLWSAIRIISFLYGYFGARRKRREYY